jgi:DNA-formamidopyrimidine glycosylase
MPEGPEVVISTQYLKSKLLNKHVSFVKVLSGRYTRQKLEGLSLFKKGHTYKITEIDSKGKFIWFVLTDTSNKNDKIYVTNTLGMTGKWGFYKDSSARVRFRICCETKNKKYNLYYSDQRNFGTLNFYSDRDELDKKLDKLAPDILKGGLTDKSVVDLMNEFIKNSKKNKNIVKVLMDQSTLVSGIGNYLVAEILYDAKMNPHKTLDKLSAAEKKRLAHSMRKISKQSYYDNKTGYMKHFVQFMEDHPVKVDKRIFPNYHPDIKAGKAFQFKVYNQKTDPKGNKIKTDNIIKERTIHWVPKIQK